MPAYIDKPFFSKVARLALPVSLQFLLFSSRYIVDVFMLGQIGENELAAVGLVASAYMVANHLIFGLTAGIGILGAQYFGAKDETGIQKTIGLGLVVGMVFVIPVLLLFMFSPEVVVSIGTDKPELIPLGSRYLTITAFTLVTIGISASFQSGLNSMGKPQFNLIFTAVGVATNIFLNWILIFGNLGAPALGLEGAAIGTMCASIVEVLVVIIFFYSRPHPLAVGIKTIKEAVNKTDLNRFLRVSLPLTAGGIVWSVGAFVYRIVYGHMESVELAVMTMLEPLNAICFSFFWGISSATGVIMGHHLGANEFKQAWVRSWFLTLMGFSVSIVAALGIWTFRSSIFTLFGSLEPTTITMADEVLVFLLLTVWLRAVNVVSIVGVLQSGADNRFVLIMDVFCQWGVGIPLAFLAAFYWELPLKWVYLAATGEEMVKLFICLPRMYSKVWIRNLVKKPQTTSLGEQQTAS